MVGTDGSGLRRVGPASRQWERGTWSLPFSPDGRSIAYSDQGPGPGGESAPQVFTLDLSDGRRTQVTQLSSPAVHLYPLRFVTDNALVFVTEKPGELGVSRLVATDGRGEVLDVHLPENVAGTFSPNFTITETTGRGVALLQSPGESFFKLFTLDFRYDPGSGAPRFENLLHRGAADLQPVRRLLTADAASRLPVAGQSLRREPLREPTGLFRRCPGGDLRQLTQFDPRGWRMRLMLHHPVRCRRRCHHLRHYLRSSWRSAE